MPVRAVVVDDEALGRRGIVSRLEKAGGIEIVAECASGRTAIEAVRKHRPELLFLDVQMPGAGGFEVVEAIPARDRPHIVFVTAHDRYAVRAFEVHALDYLLKPVDDARFAETLARALEAIARGREEDVGRRVAALVGGMSARSGEKPPVPADRYVVRAHGKMILVRHAEIDRVEAEGDYVRIHSGERSWLVRETLSAAERRLGTRRFLRIHRSAIVNIDRVSELVSLENGDYVVRLRDGTELRLSRTYREAVERLTGGRG